MDFTFLDKCFLAIEPKDVEAGQRTAWAGMELRRSGQHQRHPHRHDRGGIQHPLPHRRVAAVGHLAGGVAVVEAGKRDLPGKLPHRFHDRKIKRLYLYVTRYMPSKSESRQRKVKAAFRTLIERTGWIVAIAGEFSARPPSQGNAALTAVALELKAYLPSMETVVATARRAQIEGETVPASASGCSASSSSTRN
jgi:hypothetical protein